MFPLFAFTLLLNYNIESPVRCGKNTAFWIWVSSCWGWMIKLHWGKCIWTFEEWRGRHGFQFPGQLKWCGRRGMEIRLAIWTLQWSCHGANGGSGAEGQESSAPVWKINDHRATGGKDRQKQGETLKQASACLTNSKVRPAWPLLGSYDINCVHVLLVLLLKNYKNLILFSRHQNLPCCM